MCSKPVWWSPAAAKPAATRGAFRSPTWDKSRGRGEAECYYLRVQRPLFCPPPLIFFPHLTVYCIAVVRADPPCHGMRSRDSPVAVAYDGNSKTTSVAWQERRRLVPADQRLTHIDFLLSQLEATGVVLSAAILSCSPTWEARQDISATVAAATSAPSFHPKEVVSYFLDKQQTDAIFREQPAASPPSACAGDPLADRVPAILASLSTTAYGPDSPFWFGLLPPGLALSTVPLRAPATDVPPPSPTPDPSLYAMSPSPTESTATGLQQFWETLATHILQHLFGGPASAAAKGSRGYLLHNLASLQAMQGMSAAAMATLDFLLHHSYAGGSTETEANGQSLLEAPHPRLLLTMAVCLLSSGAMTARKAQSVAAILLSLASSVDTFGESNFSSAFLDELFIAVIRFCLLLPAAWPCPGGMSFSPADGEVPFSHGSSSRDVAAAVGPMGVSSNPVTRRIRHLLSSFFPSRTLGEAESSTTPARASDGAELVAEMSVLTPLQLSLWLAERVLTDPDLSSSWSLFLRMRSSAPAPPHSIRLLEDGKEGAATRRSKAVTWSIGLLRSFLHSVRTPAPAPAMAPAPFPTRAEEFCSGAVLPAAVSNGSSLAVLVSVLSLLLGLRIRFLPPSFNHAPGDGSFSPSGPAPASRNQQDHRAERFDRSDGSLDAHAPRWKPLSFEDAQKRFQSASKFSRGLPGRFLALDRRHGDRPLSDAADRSRAQSSRGAGQDEEGNGDEEHQQLECRQEEDGHRKLVRVHDYLYRYDAFDHDVSADRVGVPPLGDNIGGRSTKMASAPLDMRTGRPLLHWRPGSQRLSGSEGLSHDAGGGGGAMRFPLSSASSSWDSRRLSPPLLPSMQRSAFLQQFGGFAGRGAPESGQVGENAVGPLGAMRGAERRWLSLRR